jgi:hypothetical protein
LEERENPGKNKPALTKIGYFGVKWDKMQKEESHEEGGSAQKDFR